MSLTVNGTNQLVEHQKSKIVVSEMKLMHQV